MSPQPQRCFSCDRELEQLYVCVPEGGNLDDFLIAEAVWVSPRDRQIGFCNRCYDRRLFAGLHPDEIAALHWSFGRCESEDSPEIIEKKIERLLLASEGLPCGEVFCALAHACDLAGRRADAREWAAKAVSWAGTYPGKQVAEEILRRE
jgi:hypothetical protein